MMRTRAAKSLQGEQGFTLLEVVCALAIIAIGAAIIVPSLPHGTSRARLESYAIAAAGLLKADHDAAIRRGTQVATRVDAQSRVISSEATGRAIQIPNDVTMDALLTENCAQEPTRLVISFFSSGLSCGGVIALTRLGFGYQVRVNWLTGRVDIVAINPA